MPTFAIDIQVVQSRHERRLALVMASPAGRTLVERYCEADILVWDYEVDAGHPGWATTQIRTGEGETAEKLACFLAFKTDTPVSYIHDLRAEDCIFEIIEPGQLPVHG